jgi:hypothetical protein
MEWMPNIDPCTPPECISLREPMPRVLHKTLHAGLISMQPFALATPEACKDISSGYAFFCVPGANVTSRGSHRGGGARR